MDSVSPIPAGQPAHEAHGHVPRRRWMIAGVLGLGVLINYLDRVNLSVSQDALSREFGISLVAFGYLLSAYSWTYALLQLPSGLVLDRFGVRRVGCVSTFLWSVASFAAAAATGFTTLFGARLLLGVGEAPTFPANAKAIGYWFPDAERSLATAIFDAAAKFASAIGVPIIGLLLLRFGWRYSFAATGAVSLLYFLLFYRLYRDPSDDAALSARERDHLAQGGAQREGAGSAPPGGALTYLLRQPEVWGLGIGFAAYNYSFYLLLTWLPTYLSGYLAVDMLHSFLYTSVPWMFATATDLIAGGWLVNALIARGWNALRVRQCVLIGGTALGLGIFGAVYARTPAAALFWISISLGGLAAAAPVAWSIPALIAPRGTVGTLGAVINFGNQLSAIAAPIATGHIVQATHSFAGAFTAAAAFLLLGICGYLFLLGDMKPIPDPRAPSTD